MGEYLEGIFLPVLNLYSHTNLFFILEDRARGIWGSRRNVGWECNKIWPKFFHHAVGGGGGRGVGGAHLMGIGLQPQHGPTCQPEWRLQWGWKKISHRIIRTDPPPILLLPPTSSSAPPSSWSSLPPARLQGYPLWIGAGLRGELKWSSSSILSSPSTR